MKVFVTGGSGLVGRRLVRRLLDRGDEVIMLTRDRARCEQLGLKGKKLSLVKGALDFQGAWRDSIGGCGAIVNLAGEGIFDHKWTDEVKRRIRESRITGTKNLVANVGLIQASERPYTLVSASAIGYYGAHADGKPLTEEARPGADFLAKLCTEWEEAARSVVAFGMRVAVLRLGIVLAPDGGALPQMAAPFKYFLGGHVGDGNQWLSWIHVDDAVALLLRALDDTTVRGPINAVAPGAAQAKDVAREIGAILGKPSWFKVPDFALRWRLGEAAEVLKSGQRVVPAAAERLGFAFKYPDLRSALGAALLDDAGAPVALGAGAGLESSRGGSRDG